MPLYEYKCETCERNYEVFQKMDRKHYYKCPECGKRARRVYAPTPFKFDFKYGWDAGLGKYVDTKKERETIMREKNLERV